MIQSFADAGTEHIFHGKETRAARSLPKPLWPVIRRKLDLLNAATTLRDLAAAPGNRLEALKGNQAGRHSIRVNQQYRVSFRFKAGNAHEVRCEDYH